MNPLFTTSTLLTLEEYKRFNWAIVRWKRSIVISVICEFFLISQAVFAHNLFATVFSILYPIFIAFTFVLSGRQIKKNYQSHKTAQNMEVIYHFYDSFLEEKNFTGCAKYEYNQLYKIRETKTNFYLMIARNQAYILIKENFPDGLAEFLREKAKEL